MAKVIIRCLFTLMFIVVGTYLPSKGRAQGAGNEADSQIIPRQTAELGKQPESSSSGPPTASVLPPHLPPSDVPSLTAKEILAANNQVISNVAAMYQHLGLFITIMTSLVGAAVAVIAFFARKSVHDFIDNWKEQLESLKQEESTKFSAAVAAAEAKLQAAVRAAEQSARIAAGHAQSIEDSKTVMATTLSEVDAMRRRFDSSPEQVAAELPIATSTTGTNVAAGDESTALGTQSATPQNSSVEDAEVAERLRGKMISDDSAGRNHE